MNQHEKLNYVEMPASDLSLIKAFFTQAFQFEFQDYGPDYCAFSAKSAGLEGGFYRAEACSSQEATAAALLVFYSKDLNSTLNKVTAAGGRINKDIFSFPGGRRFHFLDPCGNEWAVWSEQ